MKMILPAIIICGIFTGCEPDTTPAVPPGTNYTHADHIKFLQDMEVGVNRYQIYTGPIKTADGQKETVTIKLDTVTGQAWELEEPWMPSSRLSNVIARGWSPLHENVSALQSQLNPFDTPANPLNPHISTKVVVTPNEP